MKPHWKTAESRIHRTIEATAMNTVMLSSFDGKTEWPSPAATWLETMLVASRFGYVYDPPTTPQTDRLAKLEEEGDRLRILAFRNANSIEIAEERKAVLRWEAFEQWRQGPSNEEQAEAARLEREKDAREAAIKRRAAEIIIEEEQAKRIKAEQRARKELSQ